MDRDRYLALLEQDGRLLGTTAARDLDAAVPPCPGWTVRDAVVHTAEVYEHKILVATGRGERPTAWRQEPPDGMGPVEWYDDALRRVIDVLRTTDPNAPSLTWWPADQTAGFWTRRMAQETAVHRADVESAFGLITPVDAELAVDGVDEVLVQMLPGAWNDEPMPDLTGTLVVSTGGRSWHVVMKPDTVDVAEGEGDADATVTGEPSDVLLWLWGRAPDSAVKTTGDQDAVRRLRERLARTTQ
jgi:uncharacterized protein (TIGR03083 family)